MKKIFLILSCAAVMSGPVCAGGGNVKVTDKIMSRSEAKLRAVTRELWGARAVCQREYIISAMNGSEDAQEARKRFLDNAGKLGDGIQPYYGLLAGWMLSGLLKKDVSLTDEIIKAVKSGDQKEIEWVKKKWYANALAVAGFFYLARNQTMKELTDILYKHLDITWGEIQAILEKDTSAAAAYFEEDRVHMLMLSVLLNDGIVRQFPEKFED
jgi:hypothetical protein